MKANKLKVQIFLLVLLSGFPVFADKKAEEKVYKEVKKIMEMMALPRFGLYKLSGEEKYTSNGFLSASKEVLKYAAKMKDIKHPDEKFQKTNREMLEALKPFEIALKSGKKEQIKNAWLKLNISCNNCHVLYNIK